MTERRGGLGVSYDRRDFNTSPQTYRDKDFLQKIMDATGIANLDGLKVGDFMSGPGKVGLAFRERFPGHIYFFLDLSERQLNKILQVDGIVRIRADARSVPITEGALDVVIARYSIKDLPKTEQSSVLGNIKRVLKPGGILVVADMFAPTNSVKEWLNTQHSLKQELGGRNPELEGRCHLPTQGEWLQMLQGVGFEAGVFAYHVSRAETQSWVEGKQITQSDLCRLNHMILTAPPEIIAQFKIQSASHPQWTGNAKITQGEVIEAGERLKVTIEYPIVIIQAFKEN